MGVMKRSTRRIIFYLLVFLFAVVGPLAVLFSLGYTFSPATVTFETTGGIFIKSDTPRTSVFLDGAFVRETGFITGSTLLTDVTPGTHLVRMEKLSFRPWAKTVTVVPTEVTEFRDVFLVPHAPAIATSTSRELAAARATSTRVLQFSRDKKARLIFTERGISEIIAEQVHSFTPMADGAFFVEENGFLARYDAVTRGTETIGRPGFFLDREPMRFVHSAHFLAVIDASGGLFLHDRASSGVRPVAAGAKDIAFDAEEEKLLIVKDREIVVLWLADNLRQPFQKKGELETVVRETDTIRQAGWYYETDAHIVYRTRAGIFIAEADTRGAGNTGELVQGPVDEIITSPLAPNAIFYRKGKMIHKIEL